MSNMTEPRCLIGDNASRSLFQDVFVRRGNGFVGTGELLHPGRGEVREVAPILRAVGGGLWRSWRRIQAASVIAAGPGCRSADGRANVFLRDSWARAPFARNKKPGITGRGP
jgi:hypothetical protein